MGEEGEIKMMRGILEPSQELSQLLCAVCTHKGNCWYKNESNSDCWKKESIMRILTEISQ